MGKEVLPAGSPPCPGNAEPPSHAFEPTFRGCHARAHLGVGWGQNGPPPWAGSAGGQGRGEVAALPPSGPTASSKDRRPAFRGRANFCLFLAPSEVQHPGCWEALVWIAIQRDRTSDASRAGVREQAWAHIRSPGGVATSPGTPTTAGPAAVVWPLGLQGPVYLTIGWATRWPIFFPFLSRPTGPTDLEGTGAK